jgi:hypothetical protein
VSRHGWTSSDWGTGPYPESRLLLDGVKGTLRFKAGMVATFAVPLGSWGAYLALPLSWWEGLAAFMIGVFGWMPGLVFALFLPKLNDVRATPSGLRVATRWTKWEVPWDRVDLKGMAKGDRGYYLAFRPVGCDTPRKLSLTETDARALLGSPGIPAGIPWEASVLKSLRAKSEGA